MDPTATVGTEPAATPSLPHSLYIGIPTYGKPNALFAIDSLASLVYHIGRRHPEIADVHLQRDVRTYRQEARQSIVLAAQEKKATHLLMLDDDHYFSGETFSKLWARHLADPDNVQLISALYFTRSSNCAPCIFKLTTQGTVPLFFYPKDDLYAVDVVGFGFVLFDMRIFSTITPPWFSLSIGYGEDAAFCARMVQAGKKVWVDTSAKIGHILDEPMVVDEAYYETYRRNLEMGKAQRIGADEVRLRGRPSVDTYDSTPAHRPWWKPDFTHVWNKGKSVFNAP